MGDGFAIPALERCGNVLNGEIVGQDIQRESLFGSLRQGIRNKDFDGVGTLRLGFSNYAAEWVVCAEIKTGRQLGVGSE